MSDASSPTPIRYSDLVSEWLVELGYTHCFFVAGGNIMHLLDGARRRFTCVPFVHEVACGIAAEYFNEADGQGRAFALVTAGPGVTNIVTALAGAFLESRELLVIGGQAKSTDLASGGIRQRGIQEIDGRTIARGVTVESVRVERPVSKKEFIGWVERGRQGRPGPVFIELCLDAQGAPVDRDELQAGFQTIDIGPSAADVDSARQAVGVVAELTRSAARPIWLIGGGVTRSTAKRVASALEGAGVPVMTTWNGADRVGTTMPTFYGRPNTWGQRSANVILAQADLVVALGSRLGLQQTGFNWQQFAPLAKVVQVDLDVTELAKGHPRVDVALAADANALLESLVELPYPGYKEWRAFCAEVRALLPLDDPANETGAGFVSPYRFFADLSSLTTADDIVIPCSSGGANSVAMQAFEQTFGQIVITNKGLASMGYGLSGAMGAALAWPGRRTVLVEGDGGFIQNMQELATVAVNQLDLKIFIFSNEGYGSIRMTQKNYFGGAYLGCDTKTGLGFPQWAPLFAAFGIPLLELDGNGLRTEAVEAAFRASGPHGFIVPVDTEQTYFPKITSRVTETGSMESQPLHLMSPDLSPELAEKVFVFLP